MSEFKVGDTVIITDNGLCYTSYELWAEQHNLNNFTRLKYPMVNDIGKVIVEAPHRTSGAMLCGVEIGDDHYIMGVEGLEHCHITTPIKQEKLLNDSLCLEEVSLDLRKEVIEKFKAKAYDDKVSHAYLMKKALAEYVGVDIDE